ncbi:MAG TPA: hypothetical protein VLJ76_09765 [Gaiellaceae bacterium]|nr:hypothetical protein [Gaiellaceae bacterium]
MAVAAYAYATLPTKFLSVHSSTFSAAHWLAPVLWGVFFVVIATVSPPAGIEPLVKPLEARPYVRALGLPLVWLFAVSQLWVIGLLVHFLLHNKVTNNGTELIHIAARIEGATIVIAAFVFWLMDAGGPISRHEHVPHPPEFIWPQTENPHLAPEGWQPGFLDYLYLSFTNATAFSPTDVMPLSARMKMVMMVEAGASAITLVLVAARAVNILNA